MATLILMSLVSGYAVVGTAIFGLILFLEGGDAGTAIGSALVGPIVFFPATLIASFIAFLVICAIAENK